MVAMQDAATPLANQLLIASPALSDPNFARAVTLICQHDDEGAMGVVVNRASEYTLGEVLRQMNLASHDPRLDGQVVLAGGPVEPRRGFVLHSRDWIAKDSHLVAPDIALTGSLEVLDAIAKGRGPSDYLVALGYAGWGSGQLERELAAPGWYVSMADPRKLFEMAPEDRWASAFELEGIDPAMLASSSGHA